VSRGCFTLAYKPCRQRLNPFWPNLDSVARNVTTELSPAQQQDHYMDVETGGWVSNEHDTDDMNDTKMMETLLRYRRWLGEPHLQHTMDTSVAKFMKFVDDRVKHSRVRRLQRTWADYNVNTGSRPSNSADDD
jgi:hypothetical protein